MLPNIVMALGFKCRVKPRNVVQENGSSLNERFSSLFQILNYVMHHVYEDCILHNERKTIQAAFSL